MHPTGARRPGRRGTTLLEAGDLAARILAELRETAVFGEHGLRIDLQPLPGLAVAQKRADQAGPSVVGQQRLREVAVEAVHELAQVRRAQLDVHRAVVERVRL